MLLSIESKKPIRPASQPLRQSFFKGSKQQESEREVKCTRRKNKTDFKRNGKQNEKLKHRFPIFSPISRLRKDDDDDGMNQSDAAAGTSSLLTCNILIFLKSF